MIRHISHSRHINEIGYSHRSAMYMRRPGYVDMDHAATLLLPTTPNNVEIAYTLPPKQPTPDVILRSDIMPVQQMRVAL